MRFRSNVFSVHYLDLAIYGIQSTGCLLDLLSSWLHCWSSVHADYPRYPRGLTQKMHPVAGEWGLFTTIVLISKLLNISWKNSNIFIHLIIKWMIPRQWQKCWKWISNTPIEHKSIGAVDKDKILYTRWCWFKNSNHIIMLCIIMSKQWSHLLEIPCH